MKTKMINLAFGSLATLLFCSLSWSVNARAQTQAQTQAEVYGQAISAYFAGGDSVFDGEIGGLSNLMKVLLNSQYASELAGFMARENIPMDVAQFKGISHPSRKIEIGKVVTFTMNKYLLAESAEILQLTESLKQPSTLQNPRMLLEYQLKAKVSAVKDVMDELDSQYSRPALVMGGMWNGIKAIGGAAGAVFAVIATVGNGGLSGFITVPVVAVSGGYALAKGAEAYHDFKSAVSPAEKVYYAQQLFQNLDNMLQNIELKQNQKLP